MKALKTALLIVASLAVAFSIPHMPESDSKFLITMSMGALVFFTIRTIWVDAKPRIRI